MRTKMALACALLCCVGLACSDEVGLGGTNRGEAGFGGDSGAPASATGGTAGSGTGGSAPNTCPPSQIHTGAAPGILCDQTGQTCADSETFCRCGDLTFEGRPWSCVPTQGFCPATQPSDGAECASETLDGCNYVNDAGRVECDCEGGAFVCQPSECPNWIDDGASCDAPGRQCAYFRPQYPGGPANAGNVPCVCREDGHWSCEDS